LLADPTFFFRMTSRFLLVAAAAALLMTTACGQSTNIQAQNEVFSDTLLAWAINGTPPELPSALSVADGIVKRAEGDLTFELAFDIDDQGRVVLIPVRLVGVPSTSPGRVGFQLSSTPFEQLERAPGSGYQHDSLFVAPLGSTVLMESESRVCIGFLSPRLYSKLVVDSVHAVPREIYFRLTADPNCGFRSLVPGTVPKN
jgi:hypothetical protein